MNLLDTLWPMIIIHIAMGIPICTLLLRNFFATIPVDLYQSARVDGANEWQILISVYIPISMPAFAVLGTLQFHGFGMIFFSHLSLLKVMIKELLC